MKDQAVREMEDTRQNVVVQEGITEHGVEKAEEPKSRLGVYSMENKMQIRDEGEEKRGRPEKDTVDYLPHYVNHNEDYWVKRINRKYHNDGYAIYYKLMELLGRSKNHYIDISGDDEKLDFEEEMYYCASQEIYKVLEYLSEKGIIETELYEAGYIYMPVLVNKLKECYKKRKNWAKRPYIDGSSKLSLFEYGANTKADDIDYVNFTPPNDISGD